MIGFEFKWVVDPAKSLPQLDRKMRNKGYRIALSKAGGILKSALKQHTPDDTGAIDRSLRVKTKSYKKGAVWAVVAGSKTGYTVNGRKPSTYFYPLAEGTKYRPGVHMAQRAIDQAFDQCVSTFWAKLQEVFDQYARETGA